MNRRLHILGIAWWIYLLIVMALGLPAGIYFGVGMAVLTGLVIFRRWRLPLWVYSVAAAVCFSSFSLLVYEWKFIKPTQEWEGKIVAVQAVVTDRVAKDNAVRLDLLVEPQAAAEGLAGASIRLSAPLGVDVAIGDVVKYTGKLTASARDRMRLYADGYRFSAAAYTPPERLGVRSMLPQALFAQYRARMRDSLTALLPRGEGAMLAAMLTGESGTIAPEIRRNYARAGVSHLLAVSGLHLAALCGLLEVLLAAVFLSPRRRALIQMGVVLLFMALTGFSPSVLRAGLMLLLSRTAVLLGRDADTLNSLGAAVVFILLLNPYGALDIGLQLSYLATMGIAAFSEPMTGFCTRGLLRCGYFEAHETHPKTTALLAAACVSPAASLLTLPLLAWYFGQISLIMPIVNFVIFPLAAICIPAGMLCALFGLFAQMAPLERLIGLVAGVCVGWLDRIVQWFASWRYAAISVKEDYLLIWLTATLFLFIFLWICRAKWHVVAVSVQLSICSLLLAALSYEYFWNDTARLAAVRSGEAVAIVYEGQAAVVGAPANSFELQNIECFLKDNKTTSICLLILEGCDEQYHSEITRLKQSFFIEQTVIVDQLNGFDASLFGGKTKIWVESRRADTVWIETGGVLAAKTRTMKSQQADILINRRNEMIVSPALRQTPNERYYNGAVIALAVVPGYEGDEI